VFDPERDYEPKAGDFYRRLCMVALITVGSCLSIFPSVIGYHAKTDPNHLCVALRDGWSAAAPCENSRGTLLVSLVSFSVFAILVAALIARRHTRNGRPGGRPQIANV
jgi:hypothetical protein